MPQMLSAANIKGINHLAPLMSKYIVITLRYSFSHRIKHNVYHVRFKYPQKLYLYYQIFIRMYSK